LVGGCWLDAPARPFSGSAPLMLVRGRVRPKQGKRERARARGGGGGDGRVRGRRRSTATAVVVLRRDSDGGRPVCCIGGRAGTGARRRYGGGAV